MNLIRKVLCFVLAGLLPAVPVLGSGPQPARADVVRTWMSIGGAFVSLGVMGPTAFLLCPEGTPLVNRLIVTIPVAGVAAITGAIAARWIADTAIAIPVVEVDPGYWGPFNYPQAVGMGFLAGAFWGGLLGIPVGAVAVPLISIYMAF